MAIGTGDKVPEVTLKTTKMADVTTTELFGGKRVVLFAVPGAFTPTCSEQHLPGFVAKADQIRAKGIDEIICVSVNDAFVMDAWGKAQGADDKVRMVGDGNGQLATALGLEMDASGFGLGMRGQRFSMVVDDGVVSVLNVEAPGKFDVSSAEHMLGQI